MRSIICYLLFISGCAFSSAATQDETQNFHDYVNPDEFCDDADLGLYAIGYREGNMPWVDELFCIDGGGVHVVSATKNGGNVLIQTMPTTSDAQRGTQFAWVSRRGVVDQHVALNDGLIDGCPNKDKPLAIITTDTQIASMGAFVNDGMLLCVEGDDLVLHDPSGSELYRWTKFTPIL
ncbi:MAG: hypothetical protein WCT24_01990 [Patescibacteria group bacterium]|jgi:hypothetical protein